LAAAFASAESEPSLARVADSSQVSVELVEPDNAQVVVTTTATASASANGHAIVPHNETNGTESHHQDEAIVHAEYVRAIADICECQCRLPFVVGITDRS
jgi:hypothetical protein